jgi:phosphatidylserine/phosphatidylglycerophosphate/cardiolipin synthase-like enzyme
MRKNGEVVKCPDCKKWYLASDGCSRCKESEKAESEAKGDVVFVSDDKTAPLIKDMLSRAEDSVLIASPWMWGIEDIVQRLERLKKKKVDIAILTRRSKEHDVAHEETVTQIHGLGCRIETDDDLHAKIVLVDDSELYIGSANLVETSLEKNKEAGIWTNDPITVSDAKEYLAEAFDAAFRKRLQK